MFLKGIYTVFSLASVLENNWYIRSEDASFYRGAYSGHFGAGNIRLDTAPFFALSFLDTKRLINCYPSGGTRVLGVLKLMSRVQSSFALENVL